MNRLGTRHGHLAWMAAALMATAQRSESAVAQPKLESDVADVRIKTGTIHPDHAKEPVYVEPKPLSRRQAKKARMAHLKN